MDEKEIESLVAQLKAQGFDDEKIMDTYYETFKRGEMDRKDLEVLANHLGYELDDDFKNDEHPDPIEEKGEEGVENGVTEKEAEDLKAIKPDETAEEFKEKVEEVNETDAEGDSEEEDEETEWKKANKYFKV